MSHAQPKQFMTLPEHGMHASLSTAVVTGHADHWFFIKAASQATLRAQVAASCLLQPGCGDEVLWVQVSKDMAYILAVLKRHADSTLATVQLPGGVHLHSDAGVLQVQATELQLQALEKLHMQAPQVRMQGLHADAAFERMEVRAGVVNSFIQAATHTVGRLIQKTRDCFRWTDNLDESRAGRVRTLVKGRYELQSEHATVLAKGIVKVDGEKINLG